MLIVLDQRPLLLSKRFWSKVTKTKNCWNWNRPLSKSGYGRFWLNNKTHRPHRISYILAYGSLDSKLTIDHLCRNTACVRPSHLEAVTMKVNVLRGNTVAAANKAKTKCPKNHLYLGRNVFVVNGSRVCRTCHNERARIRARRIYGCKV